MLGIALWQAYLVLASVLVVLFYALPAYHLWIWTPLGFSSVVATVAGVVRFRPRQRVAWFLLAGAELTFIAGDTVYNVLTQVLGQVSPFPSLADLCYLLTYPLLASAMFLFLHDRSSTRDRASLIDAMIITTGLGLLSWVYLVVPSFEAPDLTVAQRFISVAYPLGDVLVLAMLARLVAERGVRNRSMQLLVLGSVGLIIADVLYGLILLNGVWQVGGPVDMGWVVFYVAWGCAALHPSMTRLGEIPSRRTARTRPLRLPLLALASLIAPAVLFAESFSGGRPQARAVALFSAALFLLVIARMWGILDEHRQSIERERILRNSSGALVAARGLPDIYRVALDGATALTGGPEPAEVAIYLAEGHDVRRVAGTGGQHSAERRQALWREAVGGGDLDAAGVVSVSPLRFDGEDRGMLVVASTRPLSLDQHGALTTLATQTALALVSASLAEELSEQESAERLRGVLQNASDIVLIVSERGLITYGTPSLGRNLGRPVEDVLGHSLTEVLHEDDAADAIAVVDGFASRAVHQQTTRDWRLLHRDGSVVAFEVLSSSLLDDPRVGGIVLTMRDVSERRALEQQLEHLAFHDALTELPNRALFQDRVDHALARTARLGTVVAMLMLDLDDFKIVNDTLGHAAGDELLQQVAKRLESTLRAGATVSRFGGDEFAVLVEDLAGLAEAETLAARALHCFAVPFQVHGESLRVGASGGLVVTGGGHASLDMTEVMRCADLALYAAKDLGKGQVTLYHDDLNTRMRDRLARRADLERAIDAQEFVAHYQPIISIDTGEIVGSEALVRWAHPTLGLLYPMEFVGLAEDTGLIVDLGRQMLELACAQLREWEDAGHPGLRMSVNVSARQLDKAQFLDDVRSALDRHQVTPGRLVLELTESIFALDAPVISEQLRSLRAVGVRIAMDDFGTGYSSLSYLQRIPLDILKIDKSFVDGLGHDDDDARALVAAIITLARSLRLDVVAEGIEHAEQRDELWSMGCVLGQGYLYSKAVEPAAFLALLSGQARLGLPTSVGPRT